MFGKIFSITSIFEYVFIIILIFIILIHIDSFFYKLIEYKFSENATYIIIVTKIKVSLEEYCPYVKTTRKNLY